MSALLMLPGLLLDRRLFADQIEALGGTFEITVPDLSGHERIDRLAAALLADAPPSFALLGLSMGGYVALEIMRQAPARVTRLALLDTQARRDDPATLALREERIRRAGHDFAGVLDDVHPTWLHPERRNDPKLRTVMREMAERIGPGGFVREMRAIMSRPDSRPDLPAIRCPTLVLCGRQDALPVALHEEMAAAIPDATLVVLPDAGHLTPLESPEAVTAQLRVWLAG
jgi:pimeloyl-ACP methyl ester carboxylesterase